MIKKMVKEKYQWAVHIKGLPKVKLQGLIEALEFNISIGLDVSRNEGYLKFAKDCLGKA